MPRLKNILTITLISILSAGCATKDQILPAPKNDMREVYKQHMHGTGSGGVYDARSILRRPMVEGDVDLSQYVRDSKTELNSKFKKIPNPTLYMFVAPHISTQAGVPVPGYITEFTMWERDHYALPGEVSDMTSNF